MESMLFLFPFSFFKFELGVHTFSQITFTMMLPSCFQQTWSRAEKCAGKELFACCSNSALRWSLAVGINFDKYFIEIDLYSVGKGQQTI